MSLWKHHPVVGLCLCTALLLSACGGGGGDGGSSTPTMYSVGGTVSGLANGAAVVLQNNGGNNTTISANGSFSFSPSVTNGTAYAVTILTQPTGHTCTVTSGSGTVSGANVTGIQVTCTLNTYTISGTVSGLKSGAQVTVQNNVTDPTTVTANGAFSFATPIPYNNTYAISVLTQPTGQTCAVTSGSGTVSNANVTGIQVTCVNSYSISGIVSGLNTGAQITLLNNAGDSTTIKANGAFSFATRILEGGSYAVTVANHPPAQRCAVSAGTGSGVVSNITGISVACVAATKSVIHSFNAKPDGTTPQGIIQGSDGNFYGTTYNGGTYGPGTVFKITPAGVETVLYSFQGQGIDGALPKAGLIQGTDGNFYGTTGNGGPIGGGTVFKITPTGVKTTLFSFNGDGIGPWALVQGSDGNFYGTTSGGGPNFNGIVFKLTPAGSMTILHSFPSGATDGRDPGGRLIQGSDGDFYGMTAYGGPSDKGTVFKITSAGVKTVLYYFTGGADGGVPLGELIQGNDGNFYGTTSSGGTSNLGTVFKITPAGVETVLHSFQGGASDGSDPYEVALIQASDGNFYGTTRGGGANNRGTVFRITPAGVETVVHSFAGGTADGSYPTGLTQGSDGNLYVTTSNGGPSNSGAFVKITPAGVKSLVYAFNTGPEGRYPTSLVQGTDGNLYGTTREGGTGGSGIVFKLTPQGSQTALYTFTGSTADGRYPVSLTQGRDGNFYGTTEEGGASGKGTVFKLTPDGTETIIYAFSGSVDGGLPLGALIQGSDGDFYGTSLSGGANDRGAVYKITATGVLTVLHSFMGGPTDGNAPRSGLIQGSDGNFYGTTSSGGAYGPGTVFQITPEGIHTVLYSFKGGTTDGSAPYTALIQAQDGNFYGTTTLGGASNQGTVFKVTPTGVGTIIYSFGGGAVSDGGNPRTALIQGNDGNFYGTTIGGGMSNGGTLFKVTPTGTETVLQYFGGASPDGRSPNAFIQSRDGMFYGTTNFGGASSLGTVFRY